MSERASKNQLTQIGWEASYGAGATTTRKLLSLMVDLDPQASRTPNFAQGYNFPSSTTQGTDSTEGSMSGPLMFDELQVPLSMALGAVTPVAGTPVTAMTWTWTVPISGNITPKSAKIERGDPTTAESVLGAILTELGFSWTRESIELSSSLLALNLNESAVLTAAGITAYPQVPLDPAGIGVWLDTTSGGLGTTRMLRVFEGGVALSGLYNPIWPLNELKPSFDGVISARPDSETTMNIMANAAGKALITNLHAGDRRFLRWRIQGPQIGAGPARYMLQFDMAVEVVDVDGFTDDDGLYMIPLTLQPMADETWAKALVVTLVNTTAAL